MRAVRTSGTKRSCMDTDDLTPMAYETLSRAFEFCDVLRAEIGAAAAEFRTADDFLRETWRYLTEILADPEGYLDSWNPAGRHGCQGVPQGGEGRSSARDDHAEDAAEPARHAAI